MKQTLNALVAAATALILAAPAMADTTVAGLAPYQRPASAPVLDKAPAQPKAATGIVEPIPASVAAMLKDQGAWYSPFTRPGMVGYYDLRGWHDSKEIAHRPFR